MLIRFISVSRLYTDTVRITYISPGHYTDTASVYLCFGWTHMDNALTTLLIIVCDLH